MPSRITVSGNALPLNALEDNNSHQAGKLLPLHRQSLSPRPSLEDHITLSPQFFFLYNPLFHSCIFSLITSCSADSKLLTMAHKQSVGGGAQKKRLRTAANPETLKVASWLSSCFPTSTALCATAIKQAKGRESHYSATKIQGSDLGLVKPASRTG